MNVSVIAAAQGFSLGGKDEGFGLFHFKNVHLVILVGSYYGYGFQSCCCLYMTTEDALGGNEEEEEGLSVPT